MKIYVGGLPFSATDDTLRTIFNEYGEVTSAQVITDRDTGRSKGFAFVEMSDSDAKKAIGELNEAELEGRTLTVNEARPREQRSFGGGGGSRGGSGGGYNRNGGGGGGRRW